LIVDGVDAQDSSDQSQVFEQLSGYCVDCHADREDNGNFSIQDLAVNSSAKSGRVRSTAIVRALEVIDYHEMPPQEADSIPAEQREKIVRWLRQQLRTESAGVRPAPTKLRRLNRTEYENTIRDLFRMNRPAFVNPDRIVMNGDYFDPPSGRMPKHVLAFSHYSVAADRSDDLAGVATLPVDAPAEHGFNNQSDALSFSPALIERYFEIAKALLASSEFPELSAEWPQVFEFAETDLIDGDAVRTAASARLSRFLPRAFRRPLRADELERYTKLFLGEWRDESSPAKDGSPRTAQAAMKTTVATILVSPKFLFRGDLKPIGSAQDDSELADFQYAIASRISYFLWASMPDDELFDAAANGKLSRPDDLIAQVDRMLADRKSKSLATDFGMQWLKVRKIATAAPERKEFEQFYRRINNPVWTSMQIEQLLFFETVMLENRSILDFIDADFAYWNNDLFKLYGYRPAEVIGYTPPHDLYEDFFRVSLPASKRFRGGILTSAATLASTSATTRTSPVYRGAWMLEVLFNRPPPPPPEEVPDLEDSATKAHARDVRAMLAKHRDSPACASCHDRIDPLGLALESFDAIGRLRHKYADGTKIDVSGELFGQPFSSTAEFKKMLTKEHSGKFVSAFVQHTLKYALSRSVDVVDQQYIQAITKRVQERGNRFSEVIKAVVTSEPFSR
jgi:cytochrome c553